MRLAHSSADITRGRLRGDEGYFWDRQLRARIGQDLRSIFERSLNEPLPERLNSRLLQIETEAREDTSRDGPRKGAKDA